MKMRCACATRLKPLIKSSSKPTSTPCTFITEDHQLIQTLTGIATFEVADKVGGGGGGAGGELLLLLLSKPGGGGGGGGGGTPLLSKPGGGGGGGGYTDASRIKQSKLIEHIM